MHDFGQDLVDLATVLDEELNGDKIVFKIFFERIEMLCLSDDAEPSVANFFEQAVIFH